MNLKTDCYLYNLKRGEDEFHHMARVGWLGVVSKDVEREPEGNR